VRRLRIEIDGAVQGVGFRPHVYRLATDEGLSGWVLNDAHGVALEVEGDAEAVGRFRGRLLSDPPPRAVVESVRESDVTPNGASGFAIRESRDSDGKSVAVLPDVATCGPCLSEVRDPANRRHGYPFTNCTNCGPRFTIVRALPYDRPNTAMAGFTLCAACRAEYVDPKDRRFHAQPNACASCGPSLRLLRVSGEPVAHREEALRAACEALRAGATLAVKGLGGFHLICDARNEAATRRLRERKRREEKPFALMMRDLLAVRESCEVSREEAHLLESPERPIVLLVRRAGAPVAEGVAPGNPNLGVMLPATPLHVLMLDALGIPLVATSGNLKDEPICTEEEEARERLGGMADFLLSHDRPIARHVDDSVVRILDGVPRVLRRARPPSRCPSRAGRRPSWRSGRT
jgi:hydrogenase maturation protein HypF